MATKTHRIDTKRRTLADRIRSQRAASRIRRSGRGTAAVHALAVGLAPKQAATVAQALRRNAAKASCTGAAGTAFRKGNKVACTRYTRAEMARAAKLYRPRVEAFQAARRALIAAA